MKNVGNFGRHFPPARHPQKSAQHGRACAQAMAQFVLKIELLSHIMGTTPILEMARAYGLRPRLWLLLALNSEFVLSGMSASGKCFKCRVFNMADENTERRMTLILRKLDRQWNEKEKADNGAECVAICSGCIGSRMAKFLLFLWRENISTFSIH